ncbi:MAG TPA: SRPBCC family protein [Kofleriaceae bacterium]|nr:SRPBCC family protein [Kofleriaceae bacterium]
MRKLDPLALDDFETQPFRLTATAQLDADPISVFAELRDPSLWFPLLYKSIWKTGATSGVGAEREVRLRTFGTFRERMLAWDEGERVAFTMVGTTSPLIDRMAEDWQVSRPGGASIYTQLTFSVYATPSMIGRAATPALKIILRTLFNRAATNLQKRAGTLKREHARKVS